MRYCSLHTIRFLRQRINNQSLILLLPDIVVKRNLEKCQRLEHCSDIHPRAASHTLIDIRKLQINNVFNKLQGFLRGGRPSRELGIRRERQQ